MRKILPFVMLAFCTPAVNAQTGSSIEIAAPSGTNGYGAVRVDNPSMLGQKTTASVNYEDVEGSPYFNEKWNVAIIILTGNKSVKVDKARLDFYTGDFHYTDIVGRD